MLVENDLITKEYIRTLSLPETSVAMGEGIYGRIINMLGEIELLLTKVWCQQKRVTLIEALNGILVASMTARKTKNILTSHGKENWNLS